MALLQATSRDPRVLDGFNVSSFSAALIGSIPVQLWTALPYILTVLVLAGFVGKAIPPRAGGVPYVKER